MLNSKNYDSNIIKTINKTITLFNLTVFAVFLVTQFWEQQKL